MSLLKLKKGNKTTSPKRKAFGRTFKPETRAIITTSRTSAFNISDVALGRLEAKAGQHVLAIQAYYLNADLEADLIREDNQNLYNVLNENGRILTGAEIKEQFPVWFAKFEKDIKEVEHFEDDVQYAVPSVVYVKDIPNLINLEKNNEHYSTRNGVGKAIGLVNETTNDFTCRSASINLSDFNIYANKEATIVANDELITYYKKMYYELFSLEADFGTEIEVDEQDLDAKMFVITPIETKIYQIKKLSKKEDTLEIEDTNTEGDFISEENTSEIEDIERDLIFEEEV